MPNTETVLSRVAVNSRQFVTSTFRNCTTSSATLNKIFNFLQCLLAPSAFQFKPASLRQYISLQLEKLRSPSEAKGSSLQQALFVRSNLEVEKQLSILLRQPVRSIRTILARNRLFNRKFELRRNNVGAPKLVYEYCQNFEITQEDEYLKLVQTDNRSRILGSFHFGDFIYGSNKLLLLDKSSRRKLVLSQNVSNDAYFKNLHSAFGNSAVDRCSELPYCDTSTSDLSLILRSGNTSLLLFCDMPPGFNETVAVNFLNRQAQFSIGPAILAIVNNVPLLPTINFFDGKFNCIKLGAQIEPVLFKGETLRSGAQRITQTLISFFEEMYREYPDQWRYTGLLPAYFPSSGFSNPIL